VGIEVRHRPPRPLGSEIVPRDLMGGIERVQMRREPANDRESMRVPVGIARRRKRRPLERQLGRDRPLSPVLEPPQELGE